MKRGRKRKVDNNLLFKIATEGSEIKICTASGTVIGYFYIKNVNIEGNIDQPDGIKMELIR